MDSRAQFEEWYGNKVVFGNVLDNAFKEISWEAWQASRAAIEVELPEKISPQIGYVIGQAAIYDEAIDDCAEAIRAIGISIKGEVK